MASFEDEFNEVWEKRPEKKQLHERNASRARDAEGVATEILMHLRVLDRWSIVTNPSEVPECGAALRDGREGAKSALQRIREIADWNGDTVNKVLGVARDQFRPQVNTLERHSWVPYLWETRGQVKAAAEMLETLAQVRNASDAVQVAMQEAAQSVAAMKNAAAAEFKKIAETANEYCEKAKAAADQAQQHFETQAVAAFGHAFSEEARRANNRSMSYLFISTLIAIVAIAGIYYSGKEVSDLPSNAWPSVLATLAPRVTLSVFAVWLFGYILRLARSSAHVTIANRHRSALCSAYLAIVQKTGEPERIEFLRLILPQVAPLGRTGLLPKEDIGDQPFSQVLAALERARQ